MKIPVVPFAIIATLATPASAFLPSPKNQELARRSLIVRFDSEQENSEPTIPQLPAIGESSFAEASKMNLEDDQSQPVASVMGNKFELQYTCKVCDTRNSNRVSRIAYNNGVVISICKGCESKHWIADNLGWSDHEGGFEGDVNNIEDYFAESEDEDEIVNRVTEGVFELEQFWERTQGGTQIPDSFE